MKQVNSIFGKTIAALFGVVTVLFTVAPAFAAKNVSLPVAEAKSELTTFVDSVRNGNADQVVGIYVEDKIAMPMVQQLEGDHAFISSLPNTVTQFGLPADYGVLGVLAHNTEAGADFYSLEEGDVVFAVYGDGTLNRYQIENSEVWQAFNPHDPYNGSFESVETQETVSLRDLFMDTYTTPDTLVFQTCFAQGDNSEWGRLFITATLMN